MMQKIDAEHLDHPAKGVVGMTDFLLEEGYKVGLRKVRRMMRLDTVPKSVSEVR